MFDTEKLCLFFSKVALAEDKNLPEAMRDAIDEIIAEAQSGGREKMQEWADILRLVCRAIERILAEDAARKGLSG